MTKPSDSDKQSDRFPDEFDPNSLLPPTGPTKDAFEKVADDLFQLGDIEHVRAVEVSFHESTTDQSVDVMCSERIGSQGIGNPTRSHSSMTIGTEFEGHRITADYGSAQELLALDHIIKLVGSGLSLEEEAWLNRAYVVAQSKDDTSGEYTVGSVKDLLESSPFELLEQTVHTGSHRFQNGTHIVGHSFNGNKSFKKEWPKNQPVQVIDAETADGTHYGYSASIDGTMRLLIERPGETLPREVIPEKSFSTESAPGVSIDVTGTPEIMYMITQAIQARNEVRKLGLDTPTDGSIQEFTAVLKSAIESGISPKE